MDNQDYTEQHSMPPRDEENPIKRLDVLFAEVGQIIEDHPEFVESMDKEQFNKAVNLVEGVETDNLPARLRELARNVEDIGFAISAKDKMGDLMRTAQRLNRWANELEMEG